MDYELEKRTRKEEDTPVSRMFNGRSVFITGASGFIGRVLLEKLIRCYPGIKCIYILMRQKKSQQPDDRLYKQLLNAPIFDQVRSLKNGQQLLGKIIVIAGDLGKPNLGIGEADLQMMLEDKTLSIVFHLAATVRFDEPLKVSIELNLIATRVIIEFCRSLSSLISLCHVSTAYVNSDIRNNVPIEEKLYPIDSKPEHLIKLAEILNKDLMQILKFKMIDQKPNTYTYSKALAEHLIVEEASDLPVVIVRPSNVLAAWTEPMPGWIDNINGTTALILAIGTGLLRSLHFSETVRADIIPVDIVVNTMIASAYYTAKTNDKLNLRATEDIKIITCPPTETTETIMADTTISRHQCQPKMKQQIPIIHCSSGDSKLMTWIQALDEFFSASITYPRCRVSRYPSFSTKRNKYHDLVARIFAHYLPALIIDMICVILGRKRHFLTIYNRMHSLINAMNNFAMHNYNFDTKNFRLLQSSITDEIDRRQLYMDIENIDWHKYYSNCILGSRRYLFKEEDNTLEEARKSLARKYYIDTAVYTISIILAGACILLPITGLITT